MKKSIFITIICLVAFAVTAIAGTKLHYDNTSKPAVPIQNLKGLTPVKGHSGCVTQTITKGAIQGAYSSVNGYLGYSAEVVTAAGAAEPVKWELDGTQVATGPSFDFVNPGGSTYTRAVQRVYSTAGRALTSCTRRH